jgi:hypothetical protein
LFSFGVFLKVGMVLVIIVPSLKTQEQQQIQRSMVRVRITNTSCMPFYLIPGNGSISNNLQVQYTLTTAAKATTQAAIRLVGPRPAEKAFFVSILIIFYCDCYSSRELVAAAVMMSDEKRMNENKCWKRRQATDRRRREVHGLRA